MDDEEGAGIGIDNLVNVWYTAGESGHGGLRWTDRERIAAGWRGRWGRWCGEWGRLAAAGFGEGP